LVPRRNAWHGGYRYYNRNGFALVIDRYASVASKKARECQFNAQFLETDKGE
jgi:hypothetical protein